MKNIILVVSAILFAVGACTQHQPEKFTISGDISGLGQDTLTLQYQMGDSTAVDETVSEDGLFTFAGQLPHPVEATITAGKQKQVNLYIENSEITVQGHVDSLGKAEVSGSMVHKDFEEINKIREEFERKMQDIKTSMGNSNDPKKLKKIQSKAASLYADRREKTKEFVKSHPDSYVGLQEFRGLITVPTWDIEEVDSTYNSYSDDLKSTDLGKQIGEFIAARKQTQTGSKAPDFTLNNLDGEPVSLKSYRGQYVLLDFWASWCVPCRKEHPNYIEAYKEYEDKNFTILSVSIDTKRKKWVEAVEKDGLMWTQVSALEGFQGDVAKRYAIQAIPQNFLIGPDGTILSKNTRGDDLDQKLKEILP
jgi:peroxiredoxin